MQIFLHKIMKNLLFIMEFSLFERMKTEKQKMRNDFFATGEKYIEKSRKLLYNCTVKNTF